MEEEASNVRLVLCPKCENVLPEQPDYSVYQCGGCGAVLRGTQKGPGSADLSEKSDNEGIRGVGKDIVSETQTEKQTHGFDHRRSERVFQERPVNLISSSSSRTEKREILLDPDRSIKERIMASRSDDSAKVVNLGFSNELEENRHPYGSLRSRPVMDQRNLERNGSPTFHGNARGLSEKGRLTSFQYPDEVSANYPQGSFPGYSEPIRNRDGKNRRTTVEDLENDRTELLRKLDELTNQLSRSCDTTEKSKERFTDNSRIALTMSDPRDGQEAFVSEESSSSYNVNMRPSARGKHVLEPPSFQGPLSYVRNHALNVQAPSFQGPVSYVKNHALNEQDPSFQGPVSYVKNYALNVRDPSFQGSISYAKNHALNVQDPSFQGTVSYVKSHTLDVHDFYDPRRNAPNEFSGYEDACWPQMPRRALPRRALYQPPPQYLPPAYHDHFPEQYMDFNQDPIASHQHGTFFHQPACSCFHCYNKNRQVPPRDPPPVFSSRRSQNDPTYPIYYDHVNPVTYGPPGHNSRGFQPPQMYSREQRPQMRSSSDFESDNGGFGYRKRRVVVARESERICHPIAGGAPFITCCNCFGLLNLPRKLMAMVKKQRKIQCGACSALILIEVENKTLLVSLAAQIKQVSVPLGDGSGEMLNKNFQTSDNFDDSGYNFQLTDTETDLLPRDQRSNSSESEKRQRPRSSSSSFSKHEHSPVNSVIVQRDVSVSAVLPSKDNGSLSLPDSPLEEHLDSSSSDNVMGDKGNKSKHTDQDHEKMIANRTTSRQNSIKDAPVATEMEVFSNEYFNSGLSHDSVEMSKEEDRPSFFAGLIKRSFKDLSRSNQSMENARSNVFVNGKHIPERVVKKAEKIAGPIQPGEYWYDFRAGFWGVMGQPCLGIIPPCIEEFDHPMPENCGAGNTGVFVNGRELHQRDLDLLCGRGLPTTGDKSYVIEISGRVLDEDTGEELDSLGKLAPTFVLSDPRKYKLVLDFVTPAKKEDS
ncbi:hypothetical protein LguiB_034795 [Lonicera macranthoides]